MAVFRCIQRSALLDLLGSIGPQRVEDRFDRGAIKCTSLQGITSELVMEAGPVEVSVGSSSSDIKSSATLNVNGKTRLIKGEERAFLSAATVGPAGVTRG
jgi:hypothetical protein